MNPRFIKIGLNIILITLMAFFSVQSFYSLVESRLSVDQSPKNAKAGRPPEKSPVSRSLKKTEALESYAEIGKRNLFKTASKDDSGKKVDVTNLKDTGLKLKLWGTIQSTDGDSFAIIEDSSSKSQQLYKTGDKIKNSTVRMILREKVVLNVDGVDEILQMEKLDNRSPSSSMDFASGRGIPRSDIHARPDEEIPIDRKEVESAMGDVNNLMRQISVKPHMSDGKPDGIAVASVQANSIFKKAGLQSGDVILSIDGKEIKTFEDVMGMYESLKSSSRIEMQVKRGDTPVSLVYNLSE